MAATGGETWKQCELADRGPDRSIAACSKLLREGRAKAGAFHNRGLAYEALGNFDQAIANISAGIRLDPERAYRWQERGDIYLKQGNLSRAIADWNEAIRLDPTRAFRFHQRGNAYRAAGDLPRAIADYSEAIRLDPIKRLFRFYDRGNALRDAGQYEGALSDYEIALQLEPANAWVYLERGRAYARMGQPQLAKRDFYTALAIDPSNIDLRTAIQAENQLAAPSPDQRVDKPFSATQPETRSDARQEAVQKAERGDANAQFELGAMHASEKRYDQAVIWLRRAAEQGYAEAQYHLGYMYDNGQGVSKDGFEANSWFQKAAAQGQVDAKNRLNAATSIIEHVRSTVARVQNEIVHVRGIEARKNLEQAVARLAVAHDKMPLSELYAMKAEADSAVHIVDDVKEFRTVSEIASKRIAAIEAHLDKITSDAQIVLDLRDAIQVVKLEQGGSSLSALRDALGKLNRLYDNNREELRRRQFDVY